MHPLSKREMDVNGQRRHPPLKNPDLSLMKVVSPAEVEEEEVVVEPAVELVVV